ncbi:MAG TPA: alpha/beta hydrolase [Bryobacteraceae bacterium]|nr:alpha/beta hydrolase [Bryobacteraceae bacterium]
MKTYRVFVFTSFAWLLAACLSAAPLKTETGVINGAEYRIDIPPDWNGGLVIYCHGYSPVPGKFEKDKDLPPVQKVFTDAGYALAQSGYAAGGWAVEEAVSDTESLRRHFIQEHGKPKETYVTGHSMGGFLTMTLMEKFPSAYDAGLPLCGPLAAPEWFMGRGAFDGMVIFNYLFPGILPAPDRIPADYQGGKEVAARIQAAMEANPEKTKHLLAYFGARSIEDAAGSLAFAAYVVKEIEQRAGGNPFDNQGILYQWPGDQNALNDGVKRYAGNPRAAEYLRTWYLPTGRLTRPMLAIHTTYDPIVPVSIPNFYQELTTETGSQDLFVQQYVKHDGHCNITPGETAQGFRELREWKNGGTKPPAGAAR